MFLGLLHANHHWLITEKCHSIHLLLNTENTILTLMKRKSCHCARHEGICTGEREVKLHYFCTLAMVNLTPWPLYPRINSHRYPLSRWRSESQSPSGLLGEQKYCSHLSAIETPNRPSPERCHYTSYAAPALNVYTSNTHTESNAFRLFFAVTNQYIKAKSYVLSTASRRCRDRRRWRNAHTKPRQLQAKGSGLHTYTFSTVSISCEKVSPVSTTTSRGRVGKW
jgi:hypothetical protein